MGSDASHGDPGLSYFILNSQDHWDMYEGDKKIEDGKYLVGHLSKKSKKLVEEYRKKRETQPSAIEEDAQAMKDFEEGR